MEHEHESDLGWCVLELMGHRQLAGQLRSAELAGASFLRIDIPGSEDRAPATQFYSPGAVYAITPTSEEVARRIMSSSGFEPIARYYLLPPAAPAQEADRVIYDPDGLPGPDNDDNPF